MRRIGGQSMQSNCLVLRRLILCDKYVRFQYSRSCIRKSITESARGRNTDRLPHCRSWYRYLSQFSVSENHEESGQERVVNPHSHRRNKHSVIAPTSAESRNNAIFKDVERWRWLGEYGPAYAIHGSQIKIITTPENFYNILLHKSKTTLKRVTLSTLYIGTGMLEKQLVSTLNKTMETRPEVRVKVLLDYARGSRGDYCSSRSMLLPLVKNPNRSCKVFLYHTPTLRGIRKKILPQRWNELVGVQHMKVYIFDDSLLITGANLSNDYFTNRQDRYFLIENSKELADFYDGLISCVSTFCFQMDSMGRAQLQPQWKVHPVTGNSKEFVEQARKSIVTYYEGCMTKNQENLEKMEHNRADTWIFPLIQIGPLNISYDDDATTRALATLPPGSLAKLATGYFNLTSAYIQTMIHKSQSASFEILMAHPNANGFLGAKFPAGGIPAAYTLLAKAFFKEVNANAQTHRIKMWEYFRPNWTFHVKGLWFFPSHKSAPIMTLIGSSNFGYRSVYRDIETQLYIVTSNEDLRSALDSEQKSLYSNSSPFSENVFSRVDRLVPLWVHLVIRFFKKFF